MKNVLFFTIRIFIAASLTCAVISAQDNDNVNKPVNFRYSQNPKSRNKNPNSNKDKSPTSNPDVKTAPIISESAPIIVPQESIEPSAAPDGSKNVTIARKTLEIAKRANIDSIVPTEIYKVGNGDVLFIGLQNASKSSSYFTVLNDGTIDYPLSGEMLSVQGLTTEEIEELLRNKIKLYKDPQISVKVRDYSSHTVKILGMAEKTGDRQIQREAVPMFLIKADAIVQPRAAKAIVRRTNSTIETFDLNDSKTDNILIFPGDIIEFTNGQTINTPNSNFYYYIGGEINTGGQKEFHPGMTLSQAILASGGLRKNTVRKVIIRRKNDKGLLVSTEYNLKNIKDGKEPDPVLVNDDLIEIGQS